MLKRLVILLIFSPLLLSAGGCRCGFDCDRDDDNNDGGDGLTNFTLAMSATAIEQIRRVVLEVDSVTLRQANAEDVVEDTFTIDELDLVDSETFQIDLLDFQGLGQLEVIEDLEIDSGTYTQVILGVVVDDLNRSFVEDADGEVSELNVTNAQLSLPGFRVNSGNEQLTIEFNLGLALQFISGSSGYLLGVEGARIVDSDVDSSIVGSVESSLFDSGTPCDAKTDPLAGNLVYLYSGANLSRSDLADVFTSDSSLTIDDNAIAPYSVSALVENALTGRFDFAFGFLPAGDYTLAFTCNALEDNPVNFDGISIPLPPGQVYEVDLSADEQVECDFEDPAVCNQDSS